MILDDIRSAVEAARRGPIPVDVKHVICVGAWDGYAAARLHEAEINGLVAPDEQAPMSCIRLDKYLGLDVDRRGNGCGVWVETFEERAGA